MLTIFNHLICLMSNSYDFFSSSLRCSYLQFGSPHGLYSQSQYVAAERNEVHVNIGYRLSAFGFLAAEHPPISGNFGFKDQWLALLWIKENIASFGGKIFSFFPSLRLFFYGKSLLYDSLLF